MISAKMSDKLLQTAIDMKNLAVPKITADMIGL